MRPASKSEAAHANYANPIVDVTKVVKGPLESTLALHTRGAQCIDMEILISKNGNIDIDIDIDKRTFE